MIEETYCSFEISNILKKKGFDFTGIYEGYHIWDTKKKVENFSRSEAPHLYVPTITQGKAMKWLRDTHNLCIYTFPSNLEKYGKWESGICYCDSGIDATINAAGHIYGETYEECVDSAIMYALVNII